MTSRVEFRLLGPVEVVVDGVAVALGGAKPRVLLAALLLEHGKVVPVDRLIDVIWSDDPPDTARAVIQTYVKTLRQAFAKCGLTDVILTRSPGYVAQIPDGSLDLRRFERAFAQGRAATSAATTSELIGAALALWRGPALAGLGESLLAGEAARLDALWLAAVEERLAADLELGRHDQVLPELTALLGRFPTNERLRGWHMVALYRLGRQSEALASYREGRDVLADELGVDPGPELAAIHDSVLRGDRGLLGSAAASREPVVPAQLPLVPADFTGRSQQIATLIEELTPREDTWSPPIRVITGKGGSGKSALAARVARALAPAFPDGQLYAELRGTSDLPAEPGEVLGRFLRALGVAAESVPEALDERIEVFRSQVAHRRILVLLDDAASAGQVLPLLPGGGRCAVLITTRGRLAGLAGATGAELDVLDPDEAMQLLARIVGTQRVATETQAAADIIDRCGRMPLAIRVAGARLATRQRWPLQLLADRLADERTRLDELSIADLEVRTSFQLSYRSLDPAQRIALRRLGFLGVPEFSPRIVAWLVEVDEPSAEKIIERLVDAHLVDFARLDELGSLRYRLHDLVRIHAREEAENDERSDHLTDAVARVLGGWLSVMDLVAVESPPEDIQWSRTPVPPSPVSAEVAALAVADPQAWFDAEQPAIVVGVERAATLGLYDLVRRFASARLGPSFLGVNRFESRERINAAALAAARREDDRRGEAIMLAELGQLRYQQDRFAESLQYHTDALAMFRDLGDPHCQAVALAGLGTACREAGRLLEALHFLDQATALLRELDDVAGLAHVARMTGSVRLECGQLDQSWQDLREALAAYRAVGSRRGEALTLRNIGLYHRAVGALEESVAACAQAAEVFRLLGDKLMESYAIRAQAKAEVRLGRGADARESLQRCLAVCRAMGDRFGEAATLRTLGEVHLAFGGLADAEESLVAALAVWESMEAPLWRARTERDLAVLHEARGEYERAARLRENAMKIFHDHGAREYRELAADDGAGAL